MKGKLTLLLMKGSIFLARWQSWSIASDLKSEESFRIPWVRIPLSPTSLKTYIFKYIIHFHNNYLLTGASSLNIFKKDL